MHPHIMQVYENRKEVDVEIGEYKDPINHCIMDWLVLLANNEDMLHIMHSYGFSHLFEILNFQKYGETAVEQGKGLYVSFMGDAKINEKVVVILNQIIAVTQNSEDM